MNKMQLVAGKGNSAADPGREGDAFNKVHLATPHGVMRPLPALLPLPCFQSMCWPPT